MRYHDDKSGSKLFFIVVIFLILYLAFFKFNIQVAYYYTLQQAADFVTFFAHLFKK